MTVNYDSKQAAKAEARRLEGAAQNDTKETASGILHLAALQSCFLGATTLNSRPEVLPGISPHAAFDGVLPIGQMDCAFATAQFPTLATSGLANCIGIVAWDPKRPGTAFLAHTDAFSFLYTGSDRLGAPSISSHIKRLFEGITERGGQFDLEVILAKGMFPDKGFLDVIQNNLKHPPPNVTIKSVRELDVPDGSIAIDSRTFALHSYEPSSNPFHERNKTSEHPLVRSVIRDRKDSK